MFDEGETAERSVAEDAVGGALVGSPVSATDADAGDILRYTLNSTGAVPFSLDSETGQITLSAQPDLDRESTPAYTLTATVSDFLAASDRITITINVTEAAPPDPPPAPTSGFSLDTDSSDSPESKLTFHWHDPTLSEGPPATGYDVRYREVATPVPDWTELEDVATSSGEEVPARIGASVTGLKSNTTYEAQVRSVNGAGSSAWVPETPVQATTAEAQLIVAFSAGSYVVDEGATATVTVLVTPAADRDDDVTVTASGSGATVSGLSPSGVLAFARGQDRVAFTISGIEDADSVDGAVQLSLSLTAAGKITIGEPSAAQITVRDTVTSPGIPLGLTVEAAGPLQIDIGWEAPALDGGTPITGYVIEWSEDGESWPEANRFTTSSTTYSDGSIQPATIRFYRVSATNRVGAGQPTQPESATTPRLNVAPTFDEGETAERGIPENAPGGSVVGSPVSATDADSGDTLRYSVLSTDDSPFFIDSETGQISLASRHGLDHESMPTHTFMVTVKDSLSASDTVAVTVSVTDIDEPPPAPAGDFSFGTDSSDSAENKLTVRWPEPTVCRMVSHRSPHTTCVTGRGQRRNQYGSSSRASKRVLHQAYRDA